MLTNQREKTLFFFCQTNYYRYSAVIYIMHIWTAPMAVDKKWALFVNHAYVSDSCMWAQSTS